MIVYLISGLGPMPVYPTEHPPGIIAVVVSVSVGWSWRLAVSLQSENRLVS